MHLHRSRFVAVCATLLFAGCGSDSTTGPDPVDDREIKAAPSWATDINEIITRRGCSSGD